MEFLPLCDVLFNIISLAGYFCDVVFDVVFCYALLERGRTTYSAVVICSITFSLITSQIVSLRWYMNKSRVDSTNSSATNSIAKKYQHQQQEQQQPQIEELPVKTVKYGQLCVIALHCGMLGVLWRYAKLFVPVDLRNVKHEVRDLCMLRILHAFCEAAPMLLLQLHVYVTMQDEDYMLSTPEIKLKSLGGHITSAIVPIQQSKTQEDQINLFKELIVISVLLSLFSVCWALASFSKNVRLQNVHRLVLTWLGVIFQFIWRLGTIVSRVASLTVYASLYGYWIFLVITLHWFSMFLWLISPKNVFHGERISRLRKASLVGLIAFVYVFAYINLQEVKHRQKMVTFYVVMFLENSLLVCLWLVGIWSVKPDNWYMVPMLVFFSFAIGMGFMILYYRYFHVRRLGYLAGGRPGARPGDDMSSKDMTDGGNHHRAFISNDRHMNDGLKYSPHAIPGVFNCRFTNPVGNCATKRKKKKPTTFIPPPTLLSSLQSSTDQSNGLMSIPFWRRPLPRSQTGGSSENEGSAGSRVNIHQKLQEKKQKQLAELKIIEEEIKQGKLGGPSFATNLVESGDDGRESLLRQPIPRTKKHINVEPIEWREPSPDGGSGNKVFNDLNVLSPNLDEVNKLNKYANYDPLYNSFGLNGINIPALAKENFVAMDNTARNMSPISSQVSATESNSLSRPSVLPRSKIPHNLPRSLFAETYRSNFSSVYADGANNRSTSMSPRNTSNSPNRGALFDHHGGLYLDINHPRQISGTYSSMEHSGVENLPFPYNVIPPPKSKLDSRQTPTAPSVTAKSFAKQRLIQRQMQRAKTPEILLAPHYLDNSRIYYEWAGREQSLSRFKGNDQQRLSSGDENLDDRDESVLDGDLSGRIPSDIDSQMSLPRSYTLPREYKYYRRNKPRKFIKNEHFITSTNSSDGDVDSGDDNESERQSNQSSNRTSNNSERHSSNVRKNNNFQHPSPTSTALKANNNNNNNTSTNSTSSPLSHQQSSFDHIAPMTTKYINVIGKPLNGVPVGGGGMNANNPMNRHRLRAYGNGKGAMVRHETKL